MKLSVVFLTLFNIVYSVPSCDPDHKMLICHIPPGNPNNPQTICIDKSAWSAHLDHGDYEGNCILTKKPSKKSTPKPTKCVTLKPGVKLSKPTKRPFKSAKPTKYPSANPTTKCPSKYPISKPTSKPTEYPSANPTSKPTTKPT